MNIDELSADDFAGAVNGHFSVRMGEADDAAPAIDLELVEAGEVAQAAMGDATLEGFSLLFKGGIDSMLPQAIHHFSHEKLGTFDLFVTPVQHRDADANYYEAIINRVRE